MKRVIAIAMLILLTTTAATPHPQGFENRCRCLTFPVCWFVARYEPNGKPGDGQPEPLFWQGVLPRRVIEQFVSGYWACTQGPDYAG